MEPDVYQIVITYFQIGFFVRGQFSTTKSTTTTGWCFKYIYNTKNVSKCIQYNADAGALLSMFIIADRTIRENIDGAVHLLVKDLLMKSSIFLYLKHHC